VADILAINPKQGFTTLNHLSAALAAKTAAEAEIAELDRKIDRLSTAAQKSSPAVASLNALRDDHKRAIEAYEGDGDLPQIDLAAADRLRREIEAFEDTKASANAAITSLQQSKIKAMAIRDSAGKYAQVNGVLSLVDAETPALIDAINAAGATLTAAIGRLQSLREFTLSEARRLDEKQIFDAASRNLELERNISTRPPITIDATEFRVKLADILSNANQKDA
jgi:hypothetical protein